LKKEMKRPRQLRLRLRQWLQLEWLRKWLQLEWLRKWLQLEWLRLRHWLRLRLKLKKEIERLWRIF
jgi:hypothetical protein